MNPCNQTPYDAVSDKVLDAFMSCSDMSRWQDTLGDLLERNGWTKDEWQAEVHRRYEQINHATL